MTPSPDGGQDRANAREAHPFAATGLVGAHVVPAGGRSRPHQGVAPIAPHDCAADGPPRAADEDLEVDDGFAAMSRLGAGKALPVMVTVRPEVATRSFACHLTSGVARRCSRG